jgi:hypothetical protein
LESNTRNCPLELRVEWIAEFAAWDCARTGGEEPKKRFPMLRIRIYDAQTKARDEVQIPPNLVFVAFPLRRVRQWQHRALVNRAARRVGHPATLCRLLDYADEERPRVNGRSVDPRRIGIIIRWSGKPAAYPSPGNERRNLAWARVFGAPVLSKPGQRLCRRWSFGCSRGQATWRSR